MKNVLHKIKVGLEKHKYFVLMFVVFITIYIFSIPDSNRKNASTTKIETADTFIPAGYVLIPIELNNIDTVSALINDFGVIDVYQGKDLQNSKKLLNKVKVLRAPLNPNSYAILLPDAAAKKFMQYSGPFSGVVQNKAESSLPEDILVNNKTASKLKSLTIEYNGQ